MSKDPDSLDPYRLAFSAGGTWASTHVYSRPFTFEPGDGEPASGKFEGDLVERWELADPLTLLLHLNQSAKFDELAPLNGRQVNSEDFVKSWDRFAAESYHRATLVHSVNPLAAVETVEAVDASTVRVNLAFADSIYMSLLAGDALWIQPVEGISGEIDLQKEARGSGPFLLDQYRPSVSLSYKRNPNWFHGAGKRPYVDGVSIPIIPEQAQVDAQFRSKNLHFAAIQQANIPQFAKELVGTEVAVGSPQVRSPALSMSFLPGQPWHDVRVRRAASMAIDRDALAEVLFDMSQFEELGIDLNVRWNAPIAGGYGAFWLDPKSSEFGPAAQYVHHNIPEARKLLEAAGFGPSNPLEFDLVYAGIYYGTNWPMRAETMQAMMTEAGIKSNLVSVDYATEYIPNYFRTKALFEGKNLPAAVHFPPGGAQVDALQYFFNFLGKNGSASLTGDKFPELDDMMQKLRSVTDFEEKVAGLHDLQRWATDQMIVIPVGPETEQVDLLWEALRGPQQYRPWTTGVQFGVASNMYLFPNYWFQEPI